MYSSHTAPLGPLGDEDARSSDRAPLPLKSHDVHQQPSSAELGTRRTRPHVKRPTKQRLSAALSLAESLTTPPPAYETAIRSDSPSASPSPSRRAPRPRARPPSPSPAGSDADSDPTSDSDDPLNDLLRLTSSLLSTSTSILASSSALHSSLSRLLASDAARPPLPLPQGGGARRGPAPEKVNARLAQLEAAAARWIGGTAAGRGADPRELLAREGGGGAERAAGRVGGRQDRAERCRTVYVSAAGTGSGFRAGVGGVADEDAEAPGDGAVAEAAALGGDAPGGIVPPSLGTLRRSSSAAQELLGRIALQGCAGAQAGLGGAEAAVAARWPGRAQLTVTRALRPSTSWTTPDDLLEESTDDHEARTSVLGGASGLVPSQPLTESQPRTPTRRQRSTPFQVALSSTASLATTLSPQPSSSSLFSPAASSTSGPPLDTSPTAQRIPLSSSMSAASSAASTPYTAGRFPSPCSPASTRPAQHRRTSTATAAALSASLAQHRAGTTTSLSSPAELGSEPGSVRAGGTPGSALSALRAVGGAGVPSDAAGKVERRDSRGTAPGAEAAAAGAGDGGSSTGKGWWGWG